MLFSRSKMSLSLNGQVAITINLLAMILQSCKVCAFSYYIDKPAKNKFTPKYSTKNDSKLLLNTNPNLCQYCKQTFKCLSKHIWRCKDKHTDKQLQKEGEEKEKEKKISGHTKKTNC